MMTDSPRRRSPATGLLGNTNFVLLLCAYAVSAMGDHLSEMALLKTRNALDTAVDVTPLTAQMTFMFFLPFFVLAPIAGGLADRWSRRGLMVAADFARCLIMVFFGVLIGWTQTWGPWASFTPLLLLGAFAAVFSPARSSLLPTVISRDSLVRANAMIAGLGIIATMAAALVGGILADRYEPMVAFRADAATFVLSAVLLLAMRLPRTSRQTHQSEGVRRRRRSLRDGFKYVGAHRHVRELLVVAALVWFCGPIVSSVIPAVVRDVYGGDYTAISSYRALLGLGFILGAVSVTILGDALRSEIAITWGFFGIAVGVAVFATSVFIPANPGTLAMIGGVGIVFAGFFAVAAMAGLNALLQRTVADRFRGRIYGIKDFFCMSALLIATGMLGVPQWTRVDRWVGWILLGVSVVMLVAAIVTLSVRLRRGNHGPALNFAEHLNEFVAKFWWRLKRVGPSTVPQTGPVIVTANHRCPADPFLLSACASYRPISFMIAAEYANWPIASWFVRVIECIPVKRNSRETTSTKRAIAHLKEGKALGIFIEGGIVVPGETGRPKGGVAMLALRTGATVIPAHISGVKYHSGIARGLLTRHRARVRFGAPVDLDEFRAQKRSRDVVRAATEKIFAAVVALGVDGNDTAVAGGEDTTQWGGTEQPL